MFDPWCLQRIKAQVTVYGYGKCARCNKYDDCDGSNTTRKGSRNDERLGLDGYHPFDTESKMMAFWAKTSQILLVY